MPFLVANFIYYQSKKGSVKLAFKLNDESIFLGAPILHFKTKNMKIIKEISDIVQLVLTELGAITIGLIGLIGIIKLLIDQVKQLFN